VATATAALGTEIALAEAAAPPRPLALALAGADPLRLDLPPLPGLRVAPETLRALSALYLAARLEDAGLLAAAEALVRQRAVLRITVAAAAKLEDLARRQQQFLPVAQRHALFARLFGTGAAAGSDPAAASGFEPRLAALCSALAGDGPLPAGSADSRRLAVELAGRDLAELAGSVAGSGVALAVPRLNDHLRRAIDVLADPSIGALVGARGPWQTLRALLGPGAPDISRLIECGRHGQRVLLWLSGTVASSAAAPIPPDIAASAAAWLTACGLSPHARGEGSR
jgi:hypothetical protein